MNKLNYLIDFGTKLLEKNKLQKIKVMAISKEMINEDKINVIKVLKEYLDATEGEIQQFIKRIEGELSDLKGDIEKVKSRLKGQELEILDQLQNEAEYNGVILKSMRSSEKLVKRGSLKLKEVSLFMDMEAEFDALRNFIDFLSTIPAVIEIESLETKRNEKILPKVESKLHLKVIVL